MIEKAISEFAVWQTESILLWQCILPILTSQESGVQFWKYLIFCQLSDTDGVMKHLSFHLLNWVFG